MLREGAASAPFFIGEICLAPEAGALCPGVTLESGVQLRPPTLDKNAC